MAATHINNLRKWMAQRKLDAYILPHADRYQSEYLAPEEERLAFLSGFTGSSGQAILLLKKAALFTDGRYMLQAPQQIDTKIFEVVETPPGRPTTWLVKHLQDKAVIGLDPWLFTVQQAKTWQKAAEEHGWTLSWMPDNPIDALWTERPTPSVLPAFLHKVKHSGKSRDDKIAAYLKKIAAKADRVLLTDHSLIAWLLNLRGRDVTHNPFLQAQAIVERDGHVTLFTDERKIPDTVRKDFGNHITLAALPDLLPALAAGAKTVQIDPAQCPKAIADFCQDKKITTVEAADPAILLRAVKNRVEIKGAASVHERDKVAFTDFLAWFAKRDFAKEKISELDIVAKLHALRARDKDFVEDSFATIAGYGSNGAIIHYEPDEKSQLTLQPGSLLLLDSGAQYYMGTTDVTRTLAVGKPTAEMKRHYTAVLRGLVALSTTRFPQGTTGAQLDTIARHPIWALGLDYAHGTGHGVGSFAGVHEGPQGISSRNTTVLQPGMILSIEPGIYFENRYGIRLENLVVVVKDKQEGDAKDMYAFQTLTKIPFDKTLIDWPQLTVAERRFLLDFGTRP